jgi:hypothetical protein
MATSVNKNETVDMSDYDMESNETTETTHTLPELQNDEINRESLTEDHKSLFLPTNDYIWKNTRNFFASLVRSDSHENDVSPDGRTLWKWSGRVESKNGEHEGFFQLMMSPDKRYRKDDKGRDTKEIDNLYKAYLNADKLFYLINERQALRRTEIIILLNESSYFMNITQGKNGGNFFQSFKVIK